MRHDAVVHRARRASGRVDRVVASSVLTSSASACALNDEGAERSRSGRVERGVERRAPQGRRASRGRRASQSRRASSVAALTCARAQVSVDDVVDSSVSAYALNGEGAERSRRGRAERGVERHTSRGRRASRSRRASQSRRASSVAALTCARAQVSVGDVVDLSAGAPSASVCALSDDNARSTDDVVASSAGARQAPRTAKLLCATWT